jgi:hypothetical protein
VGLKRLQRRQLAFVGPPEAMLFYDLPGLSQLRIFPFRRHFPFAQNPPARVAQMGGGWLPLSTSRRILIFGQPVLAEGATAVT